MAKSSDAPILVWLRADLRMADHPALTAAAKSGAPVVPIYVHDEAAGGPWAHGAAKLWWLHGSLTTLGMAFAKAGAPLILRRGEGVAEVMRLARETQAAAVFFTRGYAPWMPAEEDALNDAAQVAGLECRRFGGHLLIEPEAARKKTGEPFKVFTPFWRAAAQSEPGAPLPAPKRLRGVAQAPASDALEVWNLLPTRPDWAGGLRDTWQPGEAGAQARLDAFIAGPLGPYGDARNRPDREGTSRLSPHLSLGEISARTVWHAVGAAGGRGAGSYLRELYWREFSYHLLAHFPRLPDAAFRPEYDRVQWRSDAKALRAWQQGRTGYPIVDAGMRQLWQTGWMHNRVRMITASFLIKHLLIDWREGERWFWDCLVDADIANNSASWQWVAGSGADAAPYFRVFNPILQGEKFDPAGDYVREFVPELAGMAKADIHTPWLAAKPPAPYPAPIIDHAEGRARALAAYGAIREG